jgi:hypothetical protein
MNYSQLVQAVKDYTENTETTFVNNIDVFIKQAEERINRDVQIPELRKNATGNTSASVPYLGRPSDFLSTFSLAVIDGSNTGLPKYYGMFDGDTSSSSGNFILGPTPDAAYSVEIHYYYDPPSIVTSSTSWLGDNAETALLYGTLYEAYTFMKGEPDILQNYLQRYQSALVNMASLGVMIRMLHNGYYTSNMYLV